MGNSISNSNLIRNIGDIPGAGAMANELNKKDLAGTSLISRYAGIFTAFTSIFIVLLFGIIGGLIYLTVQIFAEEANTDKEKYAAISIIIALFLIIIAMGTYYFLYTKRELEVADKISTDILRLTTVPMTDASFKGNLLSLVARRTGYTSGPQLQRLAANINSSMIVNPRGYFEGMNGDQVVDHINNNFKNMGEQPNISAIVGFKNRNYLTPVQQNLQFGAAPFFRGQGTPVARPRNRVAPPPEEVIAPPEEFAGPGGNNDFDINGLD